MYLKFNRNTLIITIIFYVISFLAILCIQNIIYVDNYNGIDLFDIYVDKNNNKIYISNDNDEVLYVVTKNKKIFNNKYFNNNIIAPGVSGIYEFEIINNGDSSLVYKINTTNINNSKINLKYRLKRDNEYVVGNNNDWVNISKINKDNILLNSKSKHLYKLEWKWPYEDGIDNIDTQIGKKNNLKYEIEILVLVEDIIYE